MEFAVSRTDAVTGGERGGVGALFRSQRTEPSSMMVRTRAKSWTGSAMRCQWERSGGGAGVLSGEGVGCMS
ncbi:hypothetical protein AXK11_01200 [Cephaloticoccus primus]|uniref:Uncharacterized protein n=1 Tax=Cephaloticoccus primus TaxID=1548207 RepID=A0A139SU52_9BACT|nr:hypothetical protein AXK11_01200 [Cephaloticoccus primus]